MSQRSAKDLLYGKRIGPGPSPNIKPSIPQPETLAEFKRARLFEQLSEQGIRQILLFSDHGGPAVRVEPDYPDGGLGRGLVKRMFELYQEISDDLDRDDIVVSFRLPDSRARVWLNRSDYQSGRESDLTLA